MSLTKTGSQPEPRAPRWGAGMTEFGIMNNRGDDSSTTVGMTYGGVEGRFPACRQAGGSGFGMTVEKVYFLAISL